MSGKTIPVSTPCVWDGEQTTIGAVSRKYRGTVYESLVKYAIANGGAKNHDDLIRYDASSSARKSAAGRMAAKLGACHIQVVPKGK